MIIFVFVLYNSFIFFFFFDLFCEDKFLEAAGQQATLKQAIIQKEKKKEL